MQSKWCPRCSTTKSVSDFVRNRARDDGLSGYCWMCHREFCAEQRQRQRKKLIEALGGKCIQCRYSEDWRALQIDHVNGNGASERREYGSSHMASFRRKILENRNLYALLCANCNQIKRFENSEHVGNRIYNRRAPSERFHADPMLTSAKRSKSLRESWALRKHLAGVS